MAHHVGFLIWRMSAPGQSRSRYAATPPSPAMNSRRRIGHTSYRFIGSLSRPRMQGNGYVEDCRRCVKKGPRGRSSRRPWSDDLAEDTLSCSKRERSRSYATSFRGIFRHCGSGREPLCGPIEDDHPATDGRHMSVATISDGPLSKDFDGLPASASRAL